jgi:F420H(2)-dependent quinone reductase
MSDTLDWNAKTITAFRANEGRVGGPFEGAPMVLVHHRGRKSGRKCVNPMDRRQRDSIYAEQARRYPGCAEYARQMAGVRVIPVLELGRA